MRTDFADQVSVFLDQAEAAGVRHVTYLSAYGIDSAPPETAMRRVELDLLGRPGLTHAILRPAWFMQNFSETFLKPIGGAIVVPAGDGAEAFVDAEDIAAVASATLADPQAHAGAQYALTGPEALTIAEAAKIISHVSGQAVDYTDIDRGEWVAARGRRRGTSRVRGGSRHADRNHRVRSWLAAQQRCGEGDRRAAGKLR